MNPALKRSDLTTFLQKRISEYEQKQDDAKKQLQAVQADYEALIQKVNGQKEAYLQLAKLLSGFIDQLVTAEPKLLENTSQQVDIHLDLDMIKRAEDLETDLDSASLLALALVLLKQIQPLVFQFEAHESKFQQSLMMSKMSARHDQSSLFM